LDGTTFTDIGSNVSFTGTTAEGDDQPTIDLSSITGLQNVQDNTTITFRLYAWGGTSSGATFSIGRTTTSTTNNVLTINGVVEVDNSPRITPSASSVSGISYVEGAGPSSATSVSLSATNLTAGGGTITINGSTNFEVSTTSVNSGFGSSATLAYTGTGTLASNTVWIRLKAGLSSGTYSSETISINGGGATTSLTASGTVIAPSAPSAPSITSITPGNNKLTVAFTAPSSDGGVAITNYKYSINGGSSYTALSPASTSNPFEITGLTNGTTYSVVILAVNSVGDGTPSSAVNGTPAPDPIYWNFGTASGNADATSGVPSNLTVSALSQGNNNGTTTMLSNSSASSTYTNASGQFNVAAAARTGGINTAAGGSAYFEFTLTPAGGYNFRLYSISFGSRSTGTGPVSYSLRSSIDNYGSDIATGSMSSASVWQLESNTNLTTTSSTGTAVTFRIYGYAGTGSPSAGAANWRIDDLNVTVEMTCVTPTVQTATAASSTICSGTSTNINLSSSEGGITYQLRNNADNSNIGTAVTGTGSAISLPTGNLSSTTTFNVLASSPCKTADVSMSGTPTVTVRPAFTSGTISSTGETICYGGNAGEIGSATAASGGDASITYSWRSSADGYTNAISGATAATYTPPAGLTATTSYRRYANDATCNTSPTLSTGT
jgi:hypothetical protein